MKKFLLSDVKESSQQAAYLFIAANILWFVGGVAGLDYGNFGNLIQLFWSFSFAGIILGFKDLHGDAIPWLNHRSQSGWRKIKESVPKNLR